MNHRIRRSEEEWMKLITSCRQSGLSDKEWCLVNEIVLMLCTDKPETKAVVDNLIRDTLWAELPECYDEHAISVYRMKIYEYVYTRYRSVA